MKTQKIDTAGLEWDETSDDDDLLGRQFWIADPQALDRIALDIPADPGKPAIEYIYDLTPEKGTPRAYVRCAHCRYPNHWKGYVVRCPDGTRFLVGKDCGRKIYGADFRTAEREFNSQRTRQVQLRRLERVRSALPDLIAALHRFERDRVHADFRDCRTTVKRRTPDLYHQLALVSTGRSGDLVVVQRIRDHEAERRRDEKQRDADDDGEKLTMTERKKRRKAGIEPRRPKPIYQDIEQRVGPLSGRELFDARIDPQAGIVEARQTLESVAEGMLSTPTQDLPTSKIAVGLKRLASALDVLDECLAVLDAPRRFFLDTSLRTVASWANRTPACGGQYRVADSGLFGRLDGAKHEEIRLSLPPEYRVSELPEISVLRNALRAETRTSGPATGQKHPAANQNDGACAAGS